MTTRHLKSARRKIGIFAAARYRALVEKTVAICEFSVVVVTLRGRMRASKDAQDITLLYVGRSLNLPHIKKKFFQDTATVQSRTATLLTYRKHLDAAAADADVLFVDIGWPYNNRINTHGEYLELPDWVYMVTTLEPTWDDTVQNFRKTMRKNINRLIRKNGYRCEPTNDPDIIARFYPDFYKAFINSRHAGEVFESPPVFIEQRAREGTILQVIGPDGPVAAGVYYPHGDELRLFVTGMPEALVDSPPEASMSALYFFSLRYAFDHGFKAINFMGTRAFPDDGLFQFKRKWGAEIQDKFSTDSILFKPLNNSLGAAKFCETFPMIARRGGRLELVLCSTLRTLNHDDCDRLVTNFHCKGLDTARIVQVTDEARDAVPDTGHQNPAVQVVSTTLASLSATYTGRFKGPATGERSVSSAEN